jgi:hypothetical protein
MKILPSINATKKVKKSCGESKQQKVTSALELVSNFFVFLRANKNIKIKNINV